MTVTEILQSAVKDKEATFIYEGKAVGPWKVQDCKIDQDGSVVIWLPLGYIRFASVVGLDIQVKSSNIKIKEDKK